MAYLRLLSVVAIVAAASAETDLSAMVKETEKMGEELPALLKQQWADKFAEQATKLRETETALTEAEGLSGEAKSAVIKAFQSLNQNVVPKIAANLTVLVKQQAKQTKEIVEEYTTLLNERLSSQSTDEDAIHAIRDRSQTIVYSWLRCLGQIHEYAHRAFESAVRELAASQTSDEARNAVANAGIHVLEVCVTKQVDRSVLATKQIRLFNDYFEQAEKALLQLLVAAKNA